MRIIYILFIILITLTGCTQLTGKVVSVSDGDTLTMLVNNEQVRIRLHGIDCPERGQDFGTVAKDFLSEYVFGKVVQVKKMDIDRYGRIIGMVFSNGVNVNEELLKAGLAWHYKTYDSNPAWARMEKEARTSKLGLWVQSNAIPPWEYRRRK